MIDYDERFLSAIYFYNNKAVSVLEVTEHLHDIAVYERSFSCFTTENPRIEVAIGIVVSIDPLAKLIHLSGIVIAEILLFG